MHQVRDEAARKARAARALGRLVERRSAPRLGEAERVLDGFYRDQRRRLVEQLREDLRMVRWSEGRGQLTPPKLVV